MAPKIYTSPFTDVPIVNRSIFTHLFLSDEPDTIGGFPASFPAFIDAPTGTTLTRGQVKQLALSLAFGIRNYRPCPVTRGDIALIFSPNSLAWPIVLFGLVAGGLQATLANSGYNARELAFQFSDSGAKVVFTHAGGSAIVSEMFKVLGFTPTEAAKKIIVIGDSLEWAGGPGAPKSERPEDFTPWELLLTQGTLQVEENFDGTLAQTTTYICYSSGTTGKPKGVETTHRNLTSLLDIVKPAFGEIIVGQDNFLGFLPFYHIYGAIKLLHFPFTLGCPTIIMPQFDPAKFCAHIERFKITIALVVPPVLVALARHPAVDRHDLSSLKILFSGAAPLGAALSRQVQARLLAKRPPGSNIVHIMQGYGLTETSPTTHLMPAVHGLRKLGSVGYLLPNLELRLVVDGEGAGDIDAEEGQPGEIWIRGPTVMKGYLNNIIATKDCITHDGWFKTGDIGIRDEEGFYYIVDRRKELIKYKGFQVPPAELESVLLTHPDIADAAVIGVNSEKEATELPRAYIVHANPSCLKTPGDKTAFAHSVKEWIQNHVARHKFLRGGVVVIDVIPKSTAGKILRRELRDLAKTELAGQDAAQGLIQAKL